MVEKKESNLKVTVWIKKNIFLISWISILLVFGLVFIFLVPPFQKPDENTHYFRAAALYNKEFTCQTTDSKDDFAIEKKYILFPESLETTRIAYKYDEKFNKNLIQGAEERVKDSDAVESFQGFCGLPFWGYIPYTLTFFIGNVFGSLTLGFYISRLLSFLFFLFCIVWSYKKLEKSKLRYFVVFYSLIPMVLHQASAIGYDYLQLALAPVLFSYVFDFYLSSQVKKKDLILFLLVSIIFTVVKAGYYFLPFMFFLIPYRKISTSLKKYAFISIGFVIAIFIVGFSTALFFRSAGSSASNPSDVNPLLQLKNIMDIGFLFKVLINTFKIHSLGMFKSFWGMFGWLDYAYPSYIYVILSSSIFLLSFYVQKDKIFDNWFKLFYQSLLVLLLSVGFLFLSTYLLWSSVGADIINGIQGRYFLVLVPLGLVCFSAFLRGFLSSKKLRVGLVLAVLILLLFKTVNIILLRYGWY